KRTDVNPPGGARWVTVAPKGQELEIALWAVGSGVDPSQQQVSKRWEPARSPPMVLVVPDCRKAHEELSARGVEFLVAPFDHPWGTSATFKDPDGNLFSMNQPPAARPKK
ncbi:MAG: VOC family protein, partial [Thermoplasmata archaeon]|nr:VOC family protein [Thermoplasmata archaeon]